MAKAKDYEIDINIIHDFEDEHAVTITQPCDNSTSLPEFQKYQIILAKLYTGDDTCAAIYVDTGGKTLISNNTGDRANFDLVNGILEEFLASKDTKSAKSSLL